MSWAAAMRKSTSRQYSVTNDANAGIHKQLIQKDWRLWNVNMQQVSFRSSRELSGLPA